MSKLLKILALAGLLGATLLTATSVQAFWWPWNNGWGGGPWNSDP